MNPRKFIIAIGLFMVMGCTNDPCPEGSVARRDAEGNIIDCFDPVNANEVD